MYAFDRQAKKYYTQNITKQCTEVHRTYTKVQKAKPKGEKTKKELPPLIKNLEHNRSTKLNKDIEPPSKNKVTHIKKIT